MRTLIPFSMLIYLAVICLAWYAFGLNGLVIWALLMVAILTM